MVKYNFITLLLENYKNDCQEWIYSVKLLIEELNGDKLHRKNVSDRLIHNKNKNFISENDILSVTELSNRTFDNFNESKENPDRKKKQNESNSATYTEEDNELQITTHNVSQDMYDNKSNTEDTYRFNENSNHEFENKNAASFEILADDANTQRKFLENINFNDSNHISETELKNTAFNSLKTIEKLQADLMYI